MQAMREILDTLLMARMVVIGEGYKARKLYICGNVSVKKEYNDVIPEIGIAVDPLEGMNVCAMCAPWAITVLPAYGVQLFPRTRAHLPKRRFSSQARRNCGKESLSERRVKWDHLHSLPDRRVA
jgi:hypothetical protein